MSNNQELIPVFSGTIAGVSAQLVDGRELHKFLESKQQFSHWMQDRINDYKFIQDIDFRVKDNFIYDETAFGGKRKIIDYHLVLDMAKELSMVERNEKGREARRYFIECEKRLLSELPEFLKPITEPITLEDFNWRHQVMTNAWQNLQNAKVIIMLSGSELLVGKRLAKSKRLF
jgi:phage anti-repressor protein